MSICVQAPNSQDPAKAALFGNDDNNNINHGNDNDNKKMIIFRIQPGRRCLGSRAKAKQSPGRTERRQKLKKATSRLIMNLIRKMSLSLRAVISSEGHLLRKQKLLSFLVITTDILIWLPVQHYKRTKMMPYKQIFV